MLEKGDLKGWEEAYKELTYNKNGHENYEFFWDGMVDKSAMPEKNSLMFYYVYTSFAEYMSQKISYKTSFSRMKDVYQLLS